MSHGFEDDVAAIKRLPAVPTILEVVCRTTGMGFAAVARVTADRWIACSVLDEIDFGLKAGGELKVATTICSEIHESRTPVVINDVDDDAVFKSHPTPKAYGFKSYISVPIIRANGTFFGTLCAIDPRPHRLERPETIGMFTLFAQMIAGHLDIGERLEERTRERDRAWKHSRDLQVIVEIDGTFRAANKAWTTMLGWRPDEVVGRNHLYFGHPDDRPESDAALADALYDDMPVYENRVRHKNGGYSWISWVAAIEDGLVYASGRDVTAERANVAILQEAQEQLRQAQKMEAVGQLTGGVAHDFNNLLTVIRSSVDLLMRPNIKEERRQRYIEAISETTTRATKLTSQLLSFSRRQALTPKVFDVGLGIETVRDLVGSVTGSRIDVQTRIIGEDLFVDADPSQFETALVNLSVNARDAMKGEGRITMSVQRAGEIPAVRSHAPVSGNFVAVSISDTGSGIAPSNLDRIFEPFFTTKGIGHGTGLGLSQVIGFAKQSGGDVAVESKLASGTTFTLYLPRVASPEKKIEIEVTEPLIDGDGMRILIVEDNADVGSFATQTLKELGYVTDWAPDAASALEMLEAKPDEFDVVFSDVVMPGMNGIELGHEIRRRHPDLPLVLTSGYSHVLAQNGTYGFELLHKPYSIEQLSRVLHKTVAWHLGRSSPLT